jgi:WD40 repeat protein
MRIISTGNSDGTLQMFQEGAGSATQLKFERTLMQCALNIDETLIAVCVGSVLTIVDVATFEKKEALTVPQDKSIFCVQFAPHTNYVVFGGQGGMVYVVDTTTWQFVITKKLHTEAVRDLKIMPISLTVCTASWDRTISISDLLTLEVHSTFAGHTDYALAVIHSLDEQTIISGAYDKTLRVWDRSTSQCTEVLTKHVGQVYGLAMHKAGQRFASGCNAGMLVIWCMQSFNPLFELRDQGPIGILAFSWEDDLIALGIDSKGTIVCDYTNGKHSPCPISHTSRVCGLAVSSGKTPLVSH